MLAIPFRVYTCAGGGGWGLVTMDATNMLAIPIGVYMYMIGLVHAWVGGGVEGGLVTMQFYGPH